MAQRCGIVTQLKDGAARIRLEAAVCAGCRGGCGLFGAGRQPGGSPRIISLSPAASGGLQPGERVRLECDDGDMLHATLTVYSLPLAGLLCGALIGQGISAGLADVAAAAGAGLGLFASLVLLRWVSGSMVPVIRVIRGGGESGPR